MYEEGLRIPRIAGMSSASGAVLPATRQVRTSSGASASITDVSCRPACASAPGTPHECHATSRPSARSSVVAVTSAGRLPPCPLTKHSRAAQRQADHPRPRRAPPPGPRCRSTRCPGRPRAPRRRRTRPAASPAARSARPPSSRPSCPCPAGGAGRAARARRRARAASGVCRGRRPGSRLTSTESTLPVTPARRPRRSRAATSGSTGCGPAPAIPASISSGTKP